MSQKNLPLDAATVHVVALAYLKENAPEVIMAGFKPGDTWCQQLLLDLSLVRRKCTTQAAAVPQAVRSGSVALCPLFNMAPRVQLP
jgi:uncharacterized protein (DUF2237 family)